MAFWAQKNPWSSPSSASFPFESQRADRYALLLLLLLLLLRISPLLLLLLLLPLAEVGKGGRREEREEEQEDRWIQTSKVIRGELGLREQRDHQH
jgi:hypothetical protein